MEKKKKTYYEVNGINDLKKMKWFDFCISIVMVHSMNLKIFMDRFVERRIAVVCNKIDLNDYVVSSQLTMVKGMG